MNKTTIEEELKKGNSFTYYTVGKSMKPLLIARKTHVMIYPIDRALGIRKYDILLYKRKNGSLVLHRVIDLDDNVLYIRGDNTYSIENVSYDQVLGKVTHIYRNKRLFSVYYNKYYNAYIRFIIITYPVRFVINKIASFIIRIFRAIRRIIRGKR